MVCIDYIMNLHGFTHINNNNALSLYLTINNCPSSVNWHKHNTLLKEVNLDISYQLRVQKIQLTLVLYIGGNVHSDNKN